MCAARFGIAAAMRSVATASLFLSLLAVDGSARADLTPLSSSFALTASAQAGFSPTTAYTNSQSQGSTIDPLAATVSANSIYLPIKENLLATAAGSATWATPSTGQVTFTNVGWSDTIGNGNANLSGNTGWVYSFVSDVTGSFVINYSVAAQGTSATTSNPLFGLNGFYVFEGPGLLAPQNATFETGLNTSGSASLAIAAGQTYTVQINDEANISAGIGTTNSHMDGTFDFGVQNISAPEPSSALTVLVVSALVGVTTLMKRHFRLCRNKS